MHLFLEVPSFGCEASWRFQELCMHVSSWYCL